MIESGIIFNIWVKAQTKQPEDCLGNDQDPLSFKSLLGIFLIFLIGFILAIILCFFEKLVSHFQRKALRLRNTETVTIKATALE